MEHDMDTSPLACGRPAAEPRAPSHPSTPRDGLYLTARVVSAVFTPFLTPFLAFCLLLSLTYLRILPTGYKLTVLGLTGSFTIVLPMVSIWLFQRINGWGVKELGDREKRFFPYALTILCYVGCLITMHHIHLPRYMCGIIAAALLCMLVCTVANLRWKISTHMASCGLMVGGLLSYSFLFQFNPVGWLSGFILLAGLLGSARIILRQHTLCEVGGGFLAGLFCGVTGILFI